MWNSGDNRCALWSELVVDGETVPLTWYYKISRAYSGTVTGYDTQYLENFDSREWDDGWLNMIREGATTAFEAWGREQKWNTSLCHPWACGPVSIILEDLSD